MVKLSLLSTKGNSARTFPHQGYLALTPIKLEGIVRTRLDEDAKLLQATDLYVALRCYEARIGRTGIQHPNLLVDHRVPLWSKPPDQPWADLGDGDWPFRLILPPSHPGHSTAHFQEYRVFWRIEAVLNHIPIPGVGHRQIKTFDLPLLRYDPGDPLPTTPSSWAHAQSIKLPTAPSLRYLINTPPFPLGPMDIVPVSLKLIPSEAQVRVSNISLAVERRLEFNDLPGSGPGNIDSLSSTTNLLDRSSRQRQSPKKAITFLVASANASDIPCDEHGIYAKTMKLQIPTPKSSSHWAVGETMRTALVTLRFFLHVKVTVTDGDTGATETLGLSPPRELRLVATNEAQRRLAVAEHERERGRVRSTIGMPAGTIGGPKGGRRPHTSGGTGLAGVLGGRKSGRIVSRSSAGTVSQPGDDDEVRSWEEGGVDSAPAVRTAFGATGDVEASRENVGEWEQELERIVVASRRRSVEMLQKGSDRRVRMHLRPRLEFER